jgi:hypothetical protein
VSRVVCINGSFVQSAAAVKSGVLSAQVYEMAIDTIMLSFCEDAESHGGHARHAPPLLLAAVGESRASEGPGGAMTKRATHVQRVQPADV